MKKKMKENKNAPLKEVIIEVEDNSVKFINIIRFRKINEEMIMNLT